MPITVEATYANGVLIPLEPLQLKDQERVTVTIHPATSLARQTAGMIPWVGDMQTLERLACDPEFGILESP
jgi:predicted DNA-binding antitoxin AbrB/MazE fold protein